MTKPINGKETSVLILEDEYGPEKFKVQTKVLIDEIKTIKYHYFLDEDYPNINPNIICYYDNVRQFNTNVTSLSDKALYRLLQYYPDLRTKLDTTSKNVKDLLAKLPEPGALLESGPDEEYTKGTMAYYQTTAHLMDVSVSKLLKTLASYAEQYNDRLTSAVLLENKHGQDDKSIYTAVVYNDIADIDYHAYHDSSGCNNEITYEHDAFGGVNTECITDAQLNTLIDYCSELISKLDSAGEKEFKNKLDKALIKEIDKLILERSLNIDDANNNTKIYTLLPCDKDKGETVLRFIPYEYIDKIYYVRDKLEPETYCLNTISYTYSVLNDSDSIVSLINDTDLHELLDAHPELKDKLMIKDKKHFN